MANLYTGTWNGFGQSEYFDQQATALAGQIAFASDSDLIDSYSVGDVGPNGLVAGVAVVATPEIDTVRIGLNAESVILPKSGDTADKIVGIVIRNQQMETNADGEACHFQGRMCNVARAIRAGARIWVRLVEGSPAPVPGTPAGVSLDTATAGQFTAAAASATVIAIPNIVFKSVADNGLALVELGVTPAAPSA